MTGLGAIRRVCLCALLAAVPAMPAGADQQSEPVHVPAPDDVAPVVFVPPAAGVPADRVGAGTRGIANDARALRLLIPEGGGVSVMDRPLLLWTLAEPFTGIMQAELIPVAGGARIAGIAQQGRFRPGLYALDMARADAGLQPGTIYRLEVLLADPATGQITTSASGLVERRSGTPPADARQAAGQGAWFDALHFLSESDFSGRARTTDAPTFAGLLDSAGLDVPAVWE